MMIEEISTLCRATTWQFLPPRGGIRPNRRFTAGGRLAQALQRGIGMLTTLREAVLGHIIMTMKTPREIPAGRFKAECLALLDQVAATGETYIVTKHGRPVAQLTPLSKASIRSLKGSVTVTGDIVAPVLGVWDAEG